MAAPTSEELRRKRQQKINGDALKASTQVAIPPVQAPAADVNANVGEMVRKSYDAPIRYFADLATQRKREYEEAKAEEDARVAEARKAAKWTAGTEVASALANLVGVAGYGASNQIIPQYSQTWMKTAADSSRQRRERLDRARALQVSADEGLANVRMKRNAAIADFAQSREQRDYERARQRRLEERQERAQNFQMEEARKTREWNERAYRDKQNQQNIKNGIDAAVAASTIAKNNAAAERSRSASSGGASSKPFAISFYGTGPDGANEVINFKDKSQLVNIVKANQNAEGIWDGLSPEEVKKVRGILSGTDISVLNGGTSADNIADRLVPYVRKSAGMMSLLREATGAARPERKAGAGVIDLSGKY